MMTSGSSVADSSTLQLQNPLLMPNQFEPWQIIPQPVPLSQTEPSYVTNRVRATSGSSVVDSRVTQLHYPLPMPSQFRKTVPVPPSTAFTVPAQADLSYATHSVQMTSSSSVIDSNAFRLQNPMPSHFEQTRQIVPQPVPPSLAFTMQAQAEPSYVTTSVCAASNISVVDSSASLNVPPPQSVSVEDTASSQCISLGDDIMSWLADNIGPDIPSSGQLDLGLLGDILSESSASTDGNAAAAAGVASNATNFSQPLMTNAELQDATNIDFTTLIGELQQLNEFGGPL